MATSQTPQQDEQPHLQGGPAGGRFSISGKTLGIVGGGATALAVTGVLVGMDKPHYRTLNPRRSRYSTVASSSIPVAVILQWNSAICSASRVGLSKYAVTR